jgi:hypothetical protein
MHYEPSVMLIGDSWWQLHFWYAGYFLGLSHFDVYDLFCLLFGARFGEIP